MRVSLGKTRLHDFFKFMVVCKEKGVFGSKNTVLSPFWWVKIFTFAYGQGWGAGPSGIKNFQSRDFRDRILQNPGIPGFFWDGISLKLLSWDFTKKVWDLLGFPSQQFGNFHTFWRTYLFVKYIRQNKVSSILYCGNSKSERVFIEQCCWQCGDPKKSLPRTNESRSMRYCQIHPLSWAFMINEK